jgi:hypothetical protein
VIVTVPTVYPGVVAEYVDVYVALRAPAWQAATVVVADPRLSVVRFRLAASPYTPEKVTSATTRAARTRFM